MAGAAKQDLPVTGGCLCGAVRYEASAPPDNTSYCHCRMCQRNVGNVFALHTTFPATALRFTKGSPKIYRSSAFAERGFCASCGSPLTFRYRARPETIAVTVGSLDRPELARPEKHEGVESWVAWLEMDDGLPRSRTEDDPDFARLSGQDETA